MTGERFSAAQPDTSNFIELSGGTGSPFLGSTAAWELRSNCSEFRDGRVRRARAVSEPSPQLERDGLVEAIRREREQELDRDAALEVANYLARGAPEREARPERELLLHGDRAA